MDEYWPENEELDPDFLSELELDALLRQRPVADDVDPEDEVDYDPYY